MAFNHDAEGNLVVLYRPFSMRFRKSMANDEHLPFLNQGVGKWNKLERDFTGVFFYKTRNVIKQKGIRHPLPG